MSSGGNRYVTYVGSARLRRSSQISTYIEPLFFFISTSTQLTPSTSSGIDTLIVLTLPKHHTCLYSFIDPSQVSPSTTQVLPSGPIPFAARVSLSACRGLD